MPESAVERLDLLFMENNVKPEVWVICGDRDHGPPSDKKIYMYVSMLLPFFLALIMAYLKALRRSLMARALRLRLLTPLRSIGCLKAAIQALRYLYKMV